MAAFLGLLRRDIRLALRQGGDVGLVLGFFVLAVLLFPFGVGPDPNCRRIGGGIVWTAALLAAVLSLDRMFAADHADGGLDLIALSRCRWSFPCWRRQWRIGSHRPAADPDEPAVGRIRQPRSEGDPGAGRGLLLGTPR